MLDWQDDLKLIESDVYLDSRGRRSICFVSHAHTDHLGSHEHAICTPATEALARRRTELQPVTALNYCTEFSLADRTQGMLLPAGQILGIAMLHVRRRLQ